MDSLVRPRHHQLVDFLFGFAALAGVSFFVGKASAPLGIAVFALGAGVYLASLRRGEKADTQLPWSAHAVSEVSSPPDALNKLESKLSSAPEVPLTGTARIDPRELVLLVDEIRIATRATPVQHQADKLEHLLLDGPRVPFTDQVRFDRRRGLKLLGEIRAHLA